MDLERTRDEEVARELAMILRAIQSETRSRVCYRLVGTVRERAIARVEDVDVDSDAPTFNSSTATLPVPAGATVLFAGVRAAGWSPIASVEGTF